MTVMMPMKKRQEAEQVMADDGHDANEEEAGGGVGDGR
jgi:hypothetical protein